MTLDNRIAEGIEELRNESLNLAATSLRANDQSRSEALFDIAVQLQALLPPDNVDDHNTTAVEQSAPISQATLTQNRNHEIRHKLGTQEWRSDTYSITRIFAMREGVMHEAELDARRISNGGQGPCVRFRGEWMTTSKAANCITGTQVNGWQNFWRYHRPDGTVGPIHELREQELRSR